MTDDTGASVVNAVATLRRLAVEVGAMLAEAERVLVHPSAPLAVTTEGLEITESVAGVVADGWLLTCDVRERKSGRGRPRRLGQLSFMVDIGREGGPAEAAGRPCIVVAWTTPDDSWTEALTDGDWWPVTPDNYDIVHERLLVWHEREVGEKPVASLDLREEAWFHVVPLYAVASADDVRRLLLRPFSRLLEGDRPEDVFAHPDASMRFAWSADRTLGFAPPGG